MLLILGTAHVLDLSIGIERAIRDFNPDIVALELDKDRFAIKIKKSERVNVEF